MVIQVDHIGSYVRFNGRRLWYHVFSDRLPPLLVVNPPRAELLMGLLREELGSFVEDGVEYINVKPLQTPAVLVWIVASITATPTRELFQALKAYTPRSPIDLVFELADLEDGYKRGRPLIPPRRLREASKTVVRILKLHGYPVEVRRE